eukprot:9908901-Heterocapsa_arctica.AAC.1
MPSGNIFAMQASLPTFSTPTASGWSHALSRGLRPRLVVVMCMLICEKGFGGPSLTSAEAKLSWPRSKPIPPGCKFSM